MIKKIEFPVAEGPLLEAPVSSNPSIALLQREVRVLRVRVSDIEEEILTLKRKFKETVEIMVTASSMAGSMWKGDK